MLPRLRWPRDRIAGHESDAFDQSWQSRLVGRKFSFSAYAYCFIAYDLVLKEWVCRPSHVTDSEVALLTAIPHLNILLDECELVAKNGQNENVLERLPQIRRYNELQLQSIHRRLADDGLESPSLSVDRDAIEILGLQYPTARG